MLNETDIVDGPLFEIKQDTAQSFITYNSDGVPIVHAHKKQFELFNASERFLLLLAGSRGGKTAMGPFWLLKQMQLKGPGEYLACSTSYPLFKKGAYKEIRRIFCTILQLGNIIGGPSGEFHFSEEGFYRVWPNEQFTEEAKVVFGHAANPDSLEAAEYKAAWCDEPGQRKFPIESWEAIQRRLAIDQGAALLTTTPYLVNHWIKSEIYDPAVRVGTEKEQTGDKDYKVISFPSIDNPAFPKEEWERAKRVLPKWRFDLFYRGLFTKPAGAIYDCFDPDIHVQPYSLTYADIPNHYPIYCGIDFGAPNFAACFLYEEMLPIEGPPKKDADGNEVKYVKTDRYVIWAEYRPNESKTAAEHVAAMLAICPRIPNKIVGGAKSEGQWRSEFRAAKWPVSEPDQSDVEVGIQRVYTAFREDRLYLTQDCKELIRELHDYSRPVDEYGEPQEGIEDANKFHSCFVAGTMVETIDGPRAIETIRPGDFVLTREGYYPVIVAGLPTKRKLIRLKYTGGELIGSPDHPVFVDGKGLVRLDSLRYNDSLISVDKSLRLHKCKRNEASEQYSTESLTTDIQIQKTGAYAAILREVQRDSIGLFGNFTTDLFQKECTYTTRTKTQPTIELRILNCLHRWSILESIQRQASVSKRIWSLSNALGRWRRHGTQAKKVCRGILKMVKSVGLNASLLRRSAIIAKRNTTISLEGNQVDFAQTNANRIGDTKRDSMTSLSSVNTVRSNSKRTNTVGWYTVLENVPLHQEENITSVISIEEFGAGEVYNLSVDGPHEYFANGVLVSNCDSLRYIVGFLLRKSGGYFFKSF